MTLDEWTDAAKAEKYQILRDFKGMPWVAVLGSSIEIDNVLLIEKITKGVFFTEDDNFLIVPED